MRLRLLLALLALAAALLAASDANERLTQAAKRSKPGSYARSWLGEPLYWTVVGAPGDHPEALLSEDGALELGKEVYSIEPFLFVEGARIAARDTVRRQSLEEGDLPIPSVHWEHPNARLRVRAFGVANVSWDRARFVGYRVENPQPVPASVELWLAIRPMQVLPTWQFLNLTPGFARIREIRLEGSRVRVNGGLSRRA